MPRPPFENRSSQAGSDYRDVPSDPRDRSSLSEDSEPTFTNPFRGDGHHSTERSSQKDEPVDESVYRSLYGSDSEDENVRHFRYEEYARAAFNTQDDDIFEEKTESVTFSGMEHPSQILADPDIDEWDEDDEFDEEIEAADESEALNDETGHLPPTIDKTQVMSTVKLSGANEGIPPEHTPEEKASTASVTYAATSNHRTAYIDVDYADIDYDREERCGFPEVIFGMGKSAEQIVGIATALLEEHGIALATRVDDEKAEVLIENFLDGTWLPSCHIFFVDRREGGAYGRNISDVLTSRSAFDLEGHVVVCCAGTADLPVAQEAAITAYLMGSKTTLVADIGVAGVHRALAHTELLRSGRVIVCVAGMEGALPSLIAGLVDVPIIAVPTSVGYGASFGGVAALLSMLSSCAGGVSVVNIDNGFGAGLTADRINRPPMRFLSNR
jgi:pyridinium-3,5-biscarboxylic acid mononucleotide synthase